MQIVKNFFTEYKNSSQVGKAAIWFMLCNLLLKGISIITVPLYTRILPESEYGTLSMYLSFEQLILVFTNWDVSAGAYQKGLFVYKDDEKYFSCVTQFFANLMTVIFFLFVGIFFKQFSAFTGLSKEIIILMSIYMLFYVGYKNWLICRQKEYDYRRAITATLSYSLLNVVVPIVALLTIEKTADVKFSAGLVVSILFMLPFYFRRLNYIRMIRSYLKFKEQFMYILKFQAPYVVYVLSFMVFAQSDRIMIGKIVGTPQAAYYSVAYNLAYVLIILQSSVDQVLIPWKYQKMNEKKYEDIKKVTSYILIVVGVIIMLFILIAPEVMKILFTTEYMEAVWCIPPIAISIYFIYLGSVFVNVESYYEKTKYVMIVSVVCSILNVALNFLLIERFGYIVCGYTTLISYVVYAFGHYGCMKKICKRDAVDVQLFDMRIVVLISIIVLLGVLLTFLYDFPIYRYSILVLIILLGIINRKGLREILIKLRSEK